jgi:hypothetical protein
MSETSNEAPELGSAEDALLKAEYDAVRAEIHNHQARRDAYLAAALTATGALGSVALSQKDNREVLLILPIILSGLALMYLKHTVDTEYLGEYLRSELWPVIRACHPDFPALPSAADQEPSRHSLLSWDDWIQLRRATLGRQSPYGLLGVLPPFLLFTATSVGSLVLSWPAGHGPAWATSWALDVSALAVAVSMTAWLTLVGPGWKRDQGSMSRAPGD